MDWPLIGELVTHITGHVLASNLHHSFLLLRPDIGPRVCESTFENCGFIELMGELIGQLPVSATPQGLPQEVAVQRC
jgi:hypothetical protein